MPELPEVETICRGVRPLIAGRSFSRVSVRRGDLRRPVPPDFCRRLEGQSIKAVKRRGKYMLLSLGSGESVIIHFGMSGRLAVRPLWPQTPDRHDHILMAIEGGQTLVFNDPRRFGLMTVAASSGLDSHPLLASLGVEPLSPQFDAAYLSAGLAGRRGVLKPALLDQALIAGIGNIYACEALYQARLSPLRPASTIQGRRAGRLVAALKAVLTAAIDAGGSSLRDHRQPNGELGYFQHNFAVYGRPGARCRRGCGAMITHIRQAGRSTFHCSRCQK